MARRILLVAAFVGGCTRGTLDLYRGEPGAVPTPSADFPSPLDTGNGADGDYVATVFNEELNECRSLILGAGSTLETSDAAPFTTGRRVLVHQVQDGLGIQVGDTADVPESGHAAGRWQLARVTTVSGTTLSLDAPLVHIYDTGGLRRAQVCTVPEFTSLTVQSGGLLSAANWDGTAGGVLAFLVDGPFEVTTFGTLSTSFDGFRGGPSTLASGGVDETDEITDEDGGGRKGEGLDGRFDQYGRGNLASGAGGGNASNAGGGGGGNGGAGGLGGKQYEPGGDLPATAGRGGSAVAGVLERRLILGGGGGAGHTDNTLGSDGEEGGGVILVVARQLLGDGEIRSDGRNAGDKPFDGAGGGGAGGTVFLRITEGAGGFGGEIYVEGGNGGDVTGATRHGPGGGGGGGRIHLDGFTLPSSQTILGGGASGVCSMLGGDPWGAEDGAPGLVDAR